MSNPNQRRVIIGFVLIGVLGLVVAAVIVGLLVGLVVRSVSDREADVSFRIEQPAGMEELQDRYELDSGSLEINLANLELPEGTTEVMARGDGCTLTVLVPRDVDVRAEAEVDSGVVSFFDRTVTGKDIEQDFEEEGIRAGRPAAVAGLSVGTGVISAVWES